MTLLLLLTILSMFFHREIPKSANDSRGFHDGKTLTGLSMFFHREIPKSANDSRA